MRAVFDLDDTICKHKNRDFANAEPIDGTIKKIRQLKRDGWQIVIYSARGQNSCKGDLLLIEQRNRKQVEEWLCKYNVPYDELRFGKPLGDIYIDDKGIGLTDFLDAPQERLHGNSGSEIYRMGKTVYKTCDNAAQQAEWYEAAKKLGIKVPQVYSVVLNTLCMEYIEPRGITHPVQKSELYSVISTIMLFSLIKENCKFEVQSLIDRLKTGHLSTYKGAADFGKLFGFLKENEEAYRDAASFCHGDLSLSNLIFAKEGIYLIDPIIHEDYSSYLLDFAKLRFSLDGGEVYLHGTAPDYKELLAEMDGVLQSNKTAKKVKALEATYWLRLLRYTNDDQRKEAVVTKAKELENEI